MTQAAAAAAGHTEESPRLAATLAELWEIAAPESVLDIGEGRELPPAARVAHAGLARATSLPFADDEFDMVSAIGVLQRLVDPDAALVEMARVARRWLLVAAPREPLARIVSLARGRHWRSLGRGPGQLNRWSRVGFVSLLTRHGRVEAIRSPLPWSMLLVRVD